MRTGSLKWLELCVVAAGVCIGAVAAPVVTNVTATQRAGTRLVDITYDVTSSSNALTVLVTVSSNNGVSYDLPATNFSGAGYGPGVLPGTGKTIVWDAGEDLTGQYSTQIWFRITADDGASPPGFSLIPADSFTMGDTFVEGHSNERPAHAVFVSAFYMEATEVTKAQWDAVYSWALTNGYAFDNAGSGKATNHPVQTVDWYDAVKWCNARSEKDGLTPCYYTSSNQTTVYRTGDVDISSACVNGSANGYRLPTEAEWEKAARGGASGHRYAWSDADTITHSRANYYSTNLYASDVSPTRGYHPTYNDGALPYTSPAGSFSANGYGLYDVVGNVWEWCWDWHEDGYYASSPGSDPQGPSSGLYRVLRGSSWDGGQAYKGRVASRDSGGSLFAINSLGFRCARGRSGQTGSGTAGPVTVLVSDIAGGGAGDYNGDGQGDMAIFDGDTGNWYIRNVAGTIIAWQIPWGWPKAWPVNGDYDGDGIGDLAVFDGNTGNWYIRNVAGTTIAWQLPWGWTNAVPVSGDYDGDGRSDLGIFDSNTGYWYVYSLTGSVLAWQVPWGWPGAEAVPGDYDGDGVSDLAVFDGATGYWYIRTMSGTTLCWQVAWGWPGAIAVGARATDDDISEEEKPEPSPKAD